MNIYWRGFITGILIFFVAGILYEYSIDLLYYYTKLFGAVKSTDSIEAGPIKITLSNATEWSTVFKMMTTILGTYLGVKIINKVIK